LWCAFGNLIKGGISERLHSEGRAFSNLNVLIIRRGIFILCCGCALDNKLQLWTERTPCLKDSRKLNKAFNQQFNILTTVTFHEVFQTATSSSFLAQSLSGFRRVAMITIYPTRF